MGHKSAEKLRCLEQQAEQHLHLFFDVLKSLPIEAIAQNGRNQDGKYFCHPRIHDALDAFLAFIFKASDLNNQLPKRAKFMQGADQFKLKLEAWMKEVQQSELAKLCARLEGVLESDGIPPFYDSYLTSLTGICRDRASIEEIEHEKQQMTQKLLEYRENHEPKPSCSSRVIRLRQACLGYQAHLRRCILEEAGLVNAYKETREVELGEKREGSHQFETEHLKWFNDQLGQISPQKCGCSLDLLIKKYKATQQFVDILSNDHHSDYEKMQHFDRSFKSAKPLLETSRDHAAIRFIKWVVFFLTGGIAGCFSLFHVHGKDLTKQAQQDLDDMQDKLYQRKDFCELKSR